MKIIKHKFVIPQLAIVNDELVETDPKEETYTFTLLHGGIGVFEENYGKSLLSVLMSMNRDNDDERIERLIGDNTFILELASASYVKIENGKFENNRATSEEFKQKEVVEHLYDVAFITKLLQMASECIVQQQKSVANNSNAKK